MMSNYPTTSLLSAIALCSAALVGGGASALAQRPTVAWQRNLDDARELAVRQQKDLLILFTGLDW